MGPLGITSRGLAISGVVVFTAALVLATPERSNARTVAPVAPVAPVAAIARGDPIAEQRVSVIALARAVQRLPAVPTVATPKPTPQPVVVAGVAYTPRNPTVPEGRVIASWYGPGFYGNRTACGQLYTPQIEGVAHKTLPCGTRLLLEFRDRTVTVAVIDRGPFIPGRELDLSNATRAALACTDLCPVRMQPAP